MPDMATRGWIRRAAKLFGEPIPANDIAHYAGVLGIQPNRLLKCMTDSGTATVRHIIRELYTQEELEEAESGVTAVSAARRTAIRSKFYLYDRSCRSNRTIQFHKNGWLLFSFRRGAAGASSSSCI